MKNKVTTNQKHVIGLQKPKIRQLKHNTKENHQTTKGKPEIERNKDEIQNQLENKV